MPYNRMLYVLFFLLISLNSCKDAKVKEWNNNEFKEAITSYCKYVDSVSYKQGFDYIQVDAKHTHDSVILVVYLAGGSYPFFNDNPKANAFFKYGKYEFLFTGDFPNEIDSLNNLENANVETIVKERYPLDYKKYLKDKKSVGPLIYDYMNMKLIFKRKKLISIKRIYY